MDVTVPPGLLPQSPSGSDLDTSAPADPESRPAGLAGVAPGVVYGTIVGVLVVVLLLAVGVAYWTRRPGIATGKATPKRTANLHLAAGVNTLPVDGLLHTQWLH